MNVIPSPHCRRRNNALTGVLAAVLSAVLAVLVLTSQPTVATTKAKRVKYTATIDIQITLTRVAAKTASGNATFTGQLSSGAPINGTGTVILDGTRTATGFRATGKGTIRFSATVTRSDGTTARMRNLSGTLAFLGSTSDGTGIFWDNTTLTFLGGSTEGTGI